MIATVFLILPEVIGIRAEGEYRSTLAQMSSNAVRVSVDSYERGWFSSSAKAIIDLGGRQIDLVQEIDHGPFPLAGSHHSLLPVLAIVENRADIPLDLKSIIHFTDESQQALTATALLFPGGSSEVRISVPPFAGGNPYAGTVIRFDGGQLVWYRRHDDMTTNGQLEHFHYADGGSQFDASALSFKGIFHKDSSGLWLHDGTWALRGLDLTFAPEPDAPEIPSHLAFDDILAAGSDTVTNGLVQSDNSLTFKRVLLPNGNTFSAGLDLQLQNLDPQALADWVIENQRITGSAIPTAPINASR